MHIDEDEYIEHYGILRRSGRYPWGSGGTNISQSKRNKQFLDYVDLMKQQGLTDLEIARGVGITTTQLRAAQTIARTQQRQEKQLTAQRLRDKGMSNVAIGEQMGINESSVRSLLAPGAKDRADILEATSNMLREEVATRGFIDVGHGVEAHLSISKEKLAAAVAILKEEGYEVHTNVKLPQPGTGLDTTFKVLAAPGTTWKDAWEHRFEITPPGVVPSASNGRSYSRPHDPLSIDVKRIGVRYAEEGGGDADGVIYVRPGVEDISLGRSRYAQVRVKVGEGHYLKGMAMYKDDLPEGTDLLFNTAKSNTGSKLDAMKKISDDPDNPFGALTDQILADVGTPRERVTSAMNIVNEEGDWTHWSKSIASQVLSKQSPALAREQLNLTFDRKLREYQAIAELTNPTVKKKLLEGFADSTDSSAVHLKAAALPRQGWFAILPVNSLRPNEVYAPQFRDGETVALIRYPHGGTFEIPELKVNNNHRESKRLLGNAPDAVAIHSDVAKRLSGADFDGDTVLVIPNNSGKVKSSPALEGLKNFDPKASYPAYDGMPVLSARRKQQEMGDVSNLVTDMTIRGASHEEIARAVRHSMVVIDIRDDRQLDYKQSAKDNGIAQLKEKYQGGANRGASTIISRAGSEIRIPERKDRPAALGGRIDRATGERRFVPTGRTRTTVTGEQVPRMQKTSKLADTTDAHTLSSGTRIERLYADHSNKLKALANRARLDMVHTPSQKYSPSAKKAYSKEVNELDEALRLAERNAPLERQAVIISNMAISARRNSNRDMDQATLKKIKGQELEKARARTGAKKSDIILTDAQWEAIQAGAISNNKLEQILQHANLERVKELATPKAQLLMSSTNINRAQALLDRGFTQAEVADHLGVSLSTLQRGLGE